ncbi:MAG TPA: hypothetical protein VMR74_01110 [Gammaproteobacteria bacterium]|nr:hypothetical protein [Gammaproteobacteria bacterium]
MNRLHPLVYSLALLLLTAGLTPPSGARTLEILEHTSELRLANVELPVIATGLVTFRLCPSCDAYSLRVTSDTEYLGFDGPLTLEELRATVTQIRLTPTGNQSTGACITYSAESQLVTRISLHPDMFRSASAD